MEGLPEQQEHIEYLKLREVWEIIGLSMTEKSFQEWRENYPVNIAVLDSGVDANHEAFSSNLHPQPIKVIIKSYVRKDGAWSAEDNQTDASGHGTFCAGVAAGYYIPSPNKDEMFKELAQEFCNLPEMEELKFSDSSKKKIEDIFQHLSGGASENLPFVGVAPFASIISYKVDNVEEAADDEEAYKVNNDEKAADDGEEAYKVDNNNNNLEEALATALQDIVECNKTAAFKDKVHIVNISLSAHYHDGVRQALYDVLNSDIIVVVAACNMGRMNNYCSGNIWFPARFGNVISVGSHNNLGQPSENSSVGREVDFLAPGEKIWGPSLQKESSAEIERNRIKKDEGTSISAAIVSGIVALVLAFVDKEKGRDARTKISNNPVMKKILRNMATRREHHDEVMGYGSLKPLVVFGCDGRVLWDLCDSKPTAHVTSSNEINTNTTAVNKFVLVDQNEDFWSSLQFTEQVEVINLVAPWDSSISLQLVLERVLEAINSSKVEVHVERLVFRTCKIKYEFSLVIQFLKDLPETVLAYLSRLDIFCGTMDSISLEDLSEIAKITEDAKQNDASTSTLIFVQSISPSTVTERDILVRKKVKIRVGINTADKDNNYYNDFIEGVEEGYLCSFDSADCFRGEFVGFSVADQIRKDYQMPCSDEIQSDKSCETYADNCVSNFYPRLPSLSNSVSSDKNITVAILCDRITADMRDIRGKPIKFESNNEPRIINMVHVTKHGGVKYHDLLGTLCTFIIAEQSNGIAPFVKLCFASVIDSKHEPNTELIVAALKRIKEKHNEVDIVVIPFGFKEFDSNLYKAINNISKGKIVICAASGSANSTRPVVSYPACYGDVISVGSHSSVFQPSAFSPQGREIDVLALGEYVTIKNHLKYVYHVGFYQFWENHALSGTCVAVACAAGVVAQILRRGLQCGFKRAEIANNTVARELLRQLTGNFSHNPQTGYGCLPDVSKSLLFRNDDYFKEIVNGILNR